MLVNSIFLGVTLVLSLASITLSAPSQVDSLEFGNRLELYRYLQRSLEDYFDSGDTTLAAQVEQAANFVLTEYGDDFYVRQCRKFRIWRQDNFQTRNQLKQQFSNNLNGLAGNRGPVDIYISQMAELGDEFLDFGDSSAAATSWQHAASKNVAGELAVKFLSRSLNVSRLCGDLDGMSRSYILLGGLLNEKMEFIRAGAYFDSARVIKAELGDNTGIAECLSNIASVYLSIGDKQNALRFAEESLSLKRKLQDSTLVYHSLVSMIPAFAREVQFTLLKSWIDEATSLGRQLHYKGEIGRLAYCRAIVAEITGDLDSAITLYDDALRTSTAGNSPRITLAILQSYAALESSLGSYAQALEHYLRAEDLAVKSRNRVALATIYHNLGSLHQRLGDLESAIDYYQRALEIRRQIDLRLQTGETLGNLSELYRAIGDTKSALEYTIKAAEIARLSNDQIGLANALINQARLEQTLGDPERAMQLLDSASAIQPGILTLQRRIDLFCLKSDFGRENKDFTLAKDFLARAKTLTDSCTTYSNMQKIDIIQSSIAVDEGQWWEAYRLLAGVIARCEKSRRTIPDPGLRGSFQSQARSVYERMVKTLYHIRQTEDNRNYDDSLLVYVEQAKSRGLLDAIAERNSPALNSKQHIENTIERKLLREIEQIESSLVDDSIPRSVKSKIATLAELEQQLSDSRLKANVKNASALSVYAPSPISIKKLQSELPDSRTALVSYLLTPDESYAILISRDRLKIELLAGRAALTRSISEYMRLIQLSIKDDDLLDSLDIAAGKVGRLLLPASLISPTSFDRILISTDGVLSILPFEALKLDNRHLIEFASVATLPSIFLFSPQVLEPPRLQNFRILALADPRSSPQQHQLPFSAREVDWVCDIFGTANCTILSASSATKAELLRLRLADYQIIHAATHSTINYRDPARSKIWLSVDTISANVESYLTLSEVDKLKLDAHLVVLSSCESGGGQLDFSEGMDGFVKAFMQAGAHNMLVSLWEVEDFTTATFMKTFYQNLSSGYAGALRRAKLEMINSPRLRHRHPYYWSPFVLTISGD